MIAPRFQVNIPEFSKAVNDRAVIGKEGIVKVWENQIRLLAGELMQRTPPFSGKKLVRMLSALARQISFRNAEIEDMSALAIGKRRVARDIRKVIYGVEGASMPKRPTPQVFKGQSGTAVTDWGILQRCEGRDAIRVYATKAGQVYGVDTMKFLDNPTMQQLTKVHNQARGNRGRVTTAGQRDKVIGRWHWLNVVVTKEKLVQQFIRLKERMVGQAKGGWAAGFIRFGGKLSPRGWIGYHAKAGKVTGWVQPGKVNVSLINESAWAGGGDPDRVMESSLHGRVEAIKADIGHILDRAWHGKRVL